MGAVTIIYFRPRDCLPEEALVAEWLEGRGAFVRADSREEAGGWLAAGT